LDADDLILRKVNLPVDETLENNVTSLRLHTKQSLSPVATLFKFFSKQPNKELLHIIVQAQGPPAPAGELSINIAPLSIHIDGGLIRIF